MLKRVGQLLLLVVYSGLSLAQAPRLSLGIRSGLNIPAIHNNDPENVPFFFTPTIGFGLTGEYCISYNLSVIAEVNYIHIDGLADGIQVISRSAYSDLPSDEKTYADYKNQLLIDGLEIPVLMRFSVGERTFLDFGGDIFILLNAKRISSGSSYIYLYNDKLHAPLVAGGVIAGQYFDQEDHIVRDLHRISAGITYGSGIGYKWKGGEILINMRVNTGLSELWKIRAKGSSNTMTNFNIGLAYIYTLSFRKIK